jgi:prepilin-type processing-associated H-X9-DG protein
LYTFSARITIGAQAFVRDDRLDPRRNVVLNLEARGTSGPALMFQSSSENASVIPALASVQRPITSSGWEACYQVLPGDTDFTVFRNAGFAGMNFAFFDGSARSLLGEGSPRDSIIVERNDNKRAVQRDQGRWKMRVR